MTMLSVAVTQDNDWYLDASGNLAMNTDQDACAQVCRQAMQGVLNEMTFNQGRGIPYFQVAFTNQPNLVQFEAAGRDTLLACDGVLAVKAFVADRSGTDLTYSATIASIYGDFAIGSNQ